MSFPEIVDLTSDDEVEEIDVKVVKKEPGLLTPPGYHYSTEQIHKEFQFNRSGQGPEEVGDSNGINTTPSSSCVLDPESSTSYASSLPPAPICRQFWKAGSYNDSHLSENPLQCGHNSLRVHPKFLHSNATSHKWAFGAIAELLDNAFDEIPHGATFVLIDKISNPRDGSLALLIQDDGGGMDPESMRHCMSFGFSDKKSTLAIGQYGNGFKTSTMRLGADVIVFSRHVDERTKAQTQSVGLLSYTFLRQTGHDRIVVPMVDFQFSESTGQFSALARFNEEHFSTNLAMLLQWSPYKTEAELMKQFDDIGQHGTKVIIYNLWHNDNGEMELDFETDAEDIILSGAPEALATSNSKAINQQHIASRLHYSLRVYSSILYLREHDKFKIILRGRVVERHNIADDLKYPEFIMYKPHVGGNTEAFVITTVGFLKDAPNVNIHGFSVYHKNRLIMPFWRVVSKTNSKGRGVAGVLEANFVEPTHNKQDFEKTSLFQKLEERLKDMTLEYWDCHCTLIGYHQTRKPSKRGPRAPKASHVHEQLPNKVNSTYYGDPPAAAPFELSGGRPRNLVANYPLNTQPGMSAKRKVDNIMLDREVKRHASSVANGSESMWTETQTLQVPALGDQETQGIMQENERLRTECLMYEKREDELKLKVQQLRAELSNVQNEYRQLLAESRLLDAIKEEKL